MTTTNTDDQRTTSVRFPNELLDALHVEAKLQGRTRSNLIRFWLERDLQQAIEQRSAGSS